MWGVSHIHVSLGALSSLERRKRACATIIRHNWNPPYIRTHHWHPDSELVFGRRLNRFAVTGERNSVFGIIRPCRHRLSERLHADWVAHLCGLCLTLRNEHGQLTRTVTNYDGLVISALVEAQSTEEAARRQAGPCPLRGMRRASVAEGEGAQLAASVSLLLASAKLRDHVDDGDGAFARVPVASVARSRAARFESQGHSSGAGVGFDTDFVVRTVARQREIEAGLSLGDSPLLATEPTESASSAAFGYTAILAQRPENAAALAEAGRFFGRIAHLVDAVEDIEEDRQNGSWNPLLATGTDLSEARRLCDDAVSGIRLALREVDWAQSALVHALLVHELEHAVRSTFGHAMPVTPGDTVLSTSGDTVLSTPGDTDQSTASLNLPLVSASSGGKPPSHQHCGDGCACALPKQLPPRRRNALVGCIAATYMCCTCQFCCRDPHPGPWSGKPRDAWCQACECCSCCEACSCCSCCDC